jgi:hypothetical protein
MSLASLPSRLGQWKGPSSCPQGRSGNAFSAPAERTQRSLKYITNNGESRKAQNRQDMGEAADVLDILQVAG